MHAYPSSIIHGGGMSRHGETCTQQASRCERHARGQVGGAWREAGARTGGGNEGVGVVGGGLGEGVGGGGEGGGGEGGGGEGEGGGGEGDGGGGIDSW